MELKGTTIENSRGNKLEFDFQIKNGEEFYKFNYGDIVTFAIYEAYGLDKEPLIAKDFKTEFGTDILTISLSEEETKIGVMQNKKVEYWYEIRLNGETIVGFDNMGAKLLILYPEGKDKTNER